MITGILLTILYTFLTYILGLFPTFSGLPEGIDTAFSSLGTILGYINNTGWPMSATLSAVAVIIGYDVIKLLFKLSNWVINKIRGSG